MVGTDELTTANPARVLRERMESVIPPRDRAADWDETWNRLVRYCDEPANKGER